MTYDEVMSRLKSLSNEMILKHNAKSGAGENQFGVKTADIRAIAKEIKNDPELAKQLWGSGNVDAMLLATLLMKPKMYSIDELGKMLEPLTYHQIVDWLGGIVKAHPDKESVREKWMSSNNEMVCRMGWSLTTERVNKNPDGLNFPALLDRIEKEMVNAPKGLNMNCREWTMNYCLAEIGIKYPEHRARATAIGEKIGAFKDYPASKGCVSPYAPSWIAEMVKRQG